MGRQQNNVDTVFDLAPDAISKRFAYAKSGSIPTNSGSETLSVHFYTNRASSASIFDHGIEMMQLDPFRQFGPFFFTQTDHIELLHNHPSQLWPAAYWEATYHACALR